MTTLSPEMFEIVGSDAFESNVISRPLITYWQDAWRRLKKKPIAMIALFVLIVMIILCIIGPYIRGFDLFLMDVKNKNVPPNATYWFGTDNLGRDLFSRIWLGSRASILVAIVCTTIQIVLGSIVGGTMAYLGGWVDEVLMRIIEILTKCEDQWKSQFLLKKGDGFNSGFNKRDGSIEVGYQITNFDTSPAELTVSLTHIYYGR